MKRIDWFRMGRDWFPLRSRGKDCFWLVSRGEGLVSAGFRVGRTGFGWFQGGKDWFRLVSCEKDWFRLVPLFSNYPNMTHFYYNVFNILLANFLPVEYSDEYPAGWYLVFARKANPRTYLATP